MGRRGFKHLKREKAKVENVEFSVPTITFQNAKEHVLVDITSRVGKVTVDQMEKITPQVQSKHKHQMKEKLKDKRKGPAEGAQDVQFAVFKLKKMCRVKCAACVAKCKDPLDPAKAAAEQGKIGSVVVLNTKAGATWCMPCYERGVVDKVKAMQPRKKGAPSPEAASGKAPALYGAFLTKEERRGAHQPRAREETAKVALSRKQRQRMNKALKKQASKGEQRGDVKQVAVPDPRVGLERRALKQQVAGKDRRRAAIAERRQMQIELKRIQTEVGITFVHVTHDQEEAMTMADTIAVMNRGVVEQLGAPADLYENPRTTFVANFLGQSNLIAAEVVGWGAVGVLIYAGLRLFGVAA